MANKYIIEGATYNGNGTSSAEATSNGGVGAWNTITYFEGTAPAYGALAAGDVVYIRSKTAAGADISRTVTTTAVTIGSATATVAANITWVLDDGTIWTGVKGTLTYNKTNTASIRLKDFNHLKALSPDQLIFLCNHGNSIASATLIVGQRCVVEMPTFDFSATMTFGSSVTTSIAGLTQNYNVLIRPKFIVSSTAGGFISVGEKGRLTLVDPSIELTKVFTATIFYPGANGASIEVYGGRLFGVGAGASITIANIAYGRVSLHGFQYPRICTILEQVGTSFTNSQGLFFESVGADGAGGSAYGEMSFFMDSRDDGNYPTLNAVLPTSPPTPWSYYVQMPFTDESTPVRIKTAKMFTGDSAQKTVNAEIQVADTLSPTKSNCWIDVFYVDSATGLQRSVSSRAPATSDPSALDASDANWSASTWGVVSLNKYRISVQTPTAIKKDSLVIVMLHSVLKSANAEQIMFVCPDAYLT